MTTPFQEKVYAVVNQVPRGRVTTYKDIAHALGMTSYRCIGQALRCNPYAPRTPCHRVVSSDGRIGGFMGSTDSSAVAKKIALLEKEGIVVRKDEVIDFERKRISF